MKFLDDQSNLKHVIMAEGDLISLGEISAGDYGNDDLGHATFPESFILTLDHKSRGTSNSQDKSVPETIEILIPESNREAFVKLLTQGAGKIRL